MVPRSRLLARAPAVLCCLAPVGLVLIWCLAAVAQNALGPVPSPSLEEMKRLVEQLGDENYSVREEASKRLLALGDPALPLLENATESADPEVRQRAWWIIDYQAARGSVSALLFQLSCSNAPIRASAAEMLGKLEARAQAALPQLIKATTDQTEFVRCSAQEAVKKIQATLPLRVEVKQNVEAIDLHGETFFRIQVSNQGKETMQDVHVLIVLPEQLCLTSVQGPMKHRSEDRHIHCEAFSLPAGEARFCEIHVQGRRAGLAQLKVEVQAGGLGAPLLGEGNVFINAAGGQ